MPELVAEEDEEEGYRIPEPWQEAGEPRCGQAGIRVAGELAPGDGRAEERRDEEEAVKPPPLGAEERAGRAQLSDAAAVPATVTGPSAASAPA